MTRGYAEDEPELFIERSGQTLSVSWSTNAWTYGLESSTNACREAAWEPIVTPIVVHSNRFVHLVPTPTAVTIVYRLKRPDGLVIIDENTVNLQNRNFASGTPLLIRSAIGLLTPNPNTGAASLQGYVNFIQNVNYAGNPAQFHLRSHGHLTLDASLMTGANLIQIVRLPVPEP